MHDDMALPIIDAHHHYWDPVANYHPWLRDEPMIPFRYGDYTSIRAPFMPEHYAAISNKFNVVATVTMEGEFDEGNLVAESAWMTRVAKAHGAPAAHVARAILHRPDAHEVIAGHAQFPIVRAIRHKPVSADAPDRTEPATPGSMSDPDWQRGYAALAKHGLHFELQAPWWHVDELIDLVARFPDTPVVINHCFMPVDRSPEALIAWRQAIHRAAQAPGITIKISGIGISGKAWVLEDQRPIIDGCIEAFGPDRCLFASNFPVDGLVGSFSDIYSGFLAATADFPLADRTAMFHDNAIRVYRLDIPPAKQSPPHGSTPATK
jgi:predicted TIM-barrel fold metal-dependent hydrolase